jgi:ABC-type antimicrobial peptide transport system permease subunit
MDHLKSSKKYIVVSLVGLVFALGLLASTLIYIDSSQGLVFNEALMDWEKESSIDLRDLSYSLKQDLLSTNITTFQSDIQSTLEDVISTLNLGDRIERNFLGTQIFGFEAIQRVNGESIRTLVSIIELNDVVKSQLLELTSSESKFPVESNDVFFFQYTTREGDSFFNPGVNETIYLTQLGLQTPVEYSLEVVGTVNVTSDLIQKTHDTVLDEFKNPPYPELGEYFERFSHGAALFVEDLDTFLPQLNIQPSQYNVNVLLKGYVKTDYTQIDMLNLDQEILTLERLYLKFRDKMVQAGYTQLNVNFNSARLFNQISVSMQGFFFNLFLFSIPIIIVSLFVAQYSFGLIHKSISYQIGTFKTRGSPDSYIYLMLFLDYLVMVGITTILAIFLFGIPLGSLIIHSDGFLSFNGFLDLEPVYNLGDLIVFLFEIGLVLGLILNFFRISRLASMKIAESEIPVDTGDPYWKRHNLDVLFTIFGAIGFFVFYSSITGDLFYLGFFTILFLPFPLIFVVGIILIFSRVVPVIIGKVSNKLWQISGNLVGFALKNIVRHKQVSTRAIMLLGTLMAFMVLFYTFPFSSAQYNNDLSLYNFGAEGIGTPLRQGELNLDNELLHILETNYSQYFEVSQFAILNFGDYGQDDFLAINSSTYLDATEFAYQPSTLRPLNETINQLGQKNDPAGILLFQKEFIKRDAKIGDTIVLSNRYSSDIFEIVDSFELWPRLYLNSWSNLDLYGVVDLSTVLLPDGSFNQTMFQAREIGYFFDFKESVDQNEVSNWLEGNFSLQMNLVSEEQADYLTSAGYLSQIGTLNANIIVSIIMGVSVVLLFSIYQLVERKKEIYTELVLGMKIQQLSVMFLVESLVLILTAILIGNFLGIGLSYMVSLFITAETNIVGMTLIFPWDLILGTQIVVIILAMVSALVPAIIVSKQNYDGTFVAE